MLKTINFKEKICYEQLKTRLNMLKKGLFKPKTGILKWLNMCEEH